MFDFNEWCKATPKIGPFNNLPKIVCQDGFSISLQAGAYQYSSPRNNNGPYSAIEAGFPSSIVEELMPYIDGPCHSPRDSVYAQVPVEIANKIINDHGGINPNNSEG